MTQELNTAHRAQYEDTVIITTNMDPQVLAARLMDNGADQHCNFIILPADKIEAIKINDMGLIDSQIDMCESVIRELRKFKSEIKWRKLEGKVK